MLNFSRLSADRFNPLVVAVSKRIYAYSRTEVDIFLSVLVNRNLVFSAFHNKVIAPV